MSTGPCNCLWTKNPDPLRGCQPSSASLKLILFELLALLITMSLYVARLSWIVQTSLTETFEKKPTTSVTGRGINFIFLLTGNPPRRSTENLPCIINTSPPDVTINHVFFLWPSLSCRHWLALSSPSLSSFAAVDKNHMAEEVTPSSHLFPPICEGYLINQLMNYSTIKLAN